MRANRLHLIPFVTLPILAFGCFRLDADPQFDAGVFHFDGGAFDGTIPDGALADAAQPEAGPRPVKVIVLKGGVPEPAVNVVFQDANGAVVEAKATGIDGSASRVVDPGTMVTVALGSGAARQLVTVIAVQPGDVLTALDDPAETFGSDAVSVDLPTNPPDGGTLYYQAHSGACRSPLSPSSPIAYAISPPDCEHAGKFPVLAIATDANALVTGFSFKKGNAIGADGGTAQVTGLSAWANVGSVNVTATNAGTQLASLGYSEIANGVALTTQASVMPAAGTATATTATYPGYADAVQFEAGRFTAATGAYLSIAMIAKRTAPPATAQSFDLAQLLPAMTNVVADTSVTARPAVTLTVAGTVTGADGLAVQMSWSASSVDAGRTTGQWIIVAPPTTTTVKAPAMPAALSAWLPPSGAAFDSPAAMIVDSDRIPGYDQLRTALATFPRPTTISPFGVAIPPLPSDGTLRVSVILYPPS